MDIVRVRVVAIKGKILRETKPIEDTFTIHECSLLNTLLDL